MAIEYKHIILHVAVALIMMVMHVQSVFPLGAQEKIQVQLRNKK